MLPIPQEQRHEEWQNILQIAHKNNFPRSLIGSDGDDDGDLITLLSFYLLENLHLSQTVSGITLRGRKFILSPKVKGYVLGICVLYDMFVIVLLSA